MGNSELACELRRPKLRAMAISETKSNAVLLVTLKFVVSAMKRWVRGLLERCQPVLQVFVLRRQRDYLLLQRRYLLWRIGRFERRNACR